MKKKVLISCISIMLLLLIISITTIYTINLPFSWEPPTTNADGTPLTDLSGYIVYYGTESGQYSQNTNVGNVTNYIAVLPNDGKTYYFAVTAYDTSGNESEYSDELTYITLDKIAPSKPTGCSWRL